MSRLLPGKGKGARMLIDFSLGSQFVLADTSGREIITLTKREHGQLEYQVPPGPGIEFRRQGKRLVGRIKSLTLPTDAV